MHFVSMISVHLVASPEIAWYLKFSPAMTSLSLFVPLIATLVTFALLGSETRSWRVIVSGIFVGLTVVLMHYMASFRLPYLDVSYTAVTVVFAIVLACAAATTALFAFFTFRAQWQDSFWKRCLCSLVLAVAVCGMHYLGLGGTSYRPKPGVDPKDLAKGGGQSHRLTITISTMCGAIILLALGMAFADWVTRRDMRKKARNIVLASACFTEDGRILVKNDGTIPMQVIQTEADLGRVLAELDPRQPTFQWLYQLSYNWHLVRPFVPRISRVIAERARIKSYETPASETTAFRGRFIEASVLLAQQLELSVEALGNLFDRVLTTGTRAPTVGENQENDDGSIHGITLKLQTSEGVLLFLVREISGGMPMAHDYPETHGYQTFDTVEYWHQRGYRLTDTRFYARTLADHMGVTKSEMDVFLGACKTYARRGIRPVVQTGGTYLGLFAVRPSNALHGLDVLVYNFARHQIPAYRLPDVSYPLTTNMKAWIRENSNLTMGELLHKAEEAVHLAETSDSGSGSIQTEDDESLYEFQAAIAIAINSLITALRPWPHIQQLARLSPEVLELPSSNFDDQPPAVMVVLEVILPAPEVKLTPVQSRASGVQAPALNTGRAETDKPPLPFIYTPWTLFAKSQNMIMRGKIWTDVCRHFSSELNSLYPHIPNDLAAEVAAADKSTNYPANPFGEKMPQYAGKWSSRKHQKGLVVDTVPGHGTSPSDTSRNASFDDVDLEKGFSAYVHVDALHNTPAPIDRRNRPTTATTESGGLKKGLTALVSRAKESVEPDEAVSAGKPLPGLPVYQSIRSKTDLWYLRSMRTMERGENGYTLDGYDWAGKAKLL